MTPQDAINLIVRSINVWLRIIGHHYTVSPCDIVVTERNGRIFLAFSIVERGEAS